MVTIKIDVTKLDKNRFFTGKKNEQTGKSPVYADLIMIEMKNPTDYATHIIKQQCSKEERQNGVDMPIIGNAKDNGGRPKNRPTHGGATGGPRRDVPF